ncbi:Camk protein kinase [Globisporangium polare]
MLMTSLQLDAPLSIQVMATSPTAASPSSSSTRTVYVRMRNVSGSVAIELSPAITSVHELIQHFHERVFSKSYMAFVKAASVLGMRTDPKTGVARETSIRDLREFLDAESLVYAPCDELRTLVEQGCITPAITSSSSRSPGSSPTSSPSLKRKGRVSSVTSNVERVHRYGAELAKMDVSPREKALIEDLLIVGDEQVVDAMEQFVVSRNTANVRRVLRGPSSSSTPKNDQQQRKAPPMMLDNLSLDFSSLDVHSPAVPANANPFLMGENPFIQAATSFHPVTEQSSAFHSFTSAVTALDDPFSMPPSSSSFSNHSHHQRQHAPVMPMNSHSSASLASSRARPSLMFGDEDMSSVPPVFLPSIREKITPPSRMSLSLDELDASTGFDELSPQLFSIAQLLDNVPVSRDFHDNYSVGKVLGSGKYSVVKGCTHLRTGDKFAVKIIDKRQMMEVKFLKRELEIMYGLRHEGVAQLVELFESNDELYLVLELCRQELFEYIDRNGPLSEAIAQKLIKKLVATVAYLHDQCIVHRDIKPENILIHGEDVSDIKLSDFGIARKLDGTVMLTPHESLTEVANLHNNDANALSSSGVRNRLARAHTKCGTRDYVAPEVMSGKGYGTEADLWSVGVVTYVLVSGCAPVFLPTADGTRKVFFSEDIWSSMSDDVKRFIEMLLVRNPEERSTAADALEHPWLTKK